MLKLVQLLLLVQMLQGCSWQQTRKTELPLAGNNGRVAEVCKVWVLVGYDSELDTAATVVEVQALNAAQRSYCSTEAAGVR